MYRKSFTENVDVIKPKLQAVINCSRQIRNSVAFRRVLEIILAVGNFLNSFNRPKTVHGFKLTSLTRLADTKSSKRSTFTLCDYIRKSVMRPPMCEHCVEVFQEDCDVDSGDLLILYSEQPIKVTPEVGDLKAAAAVGELGGLLEEIRQLRNGMVKIEVEINCEIDNSVISANSVVDLDVVERQIAAEKFFKDSMSSFAHLEGGKLVELEKLFEVCIDEYRRTLVYFGEVDPSLDVSILKKSIETDVDKPNAEKEQSLFTIIDKFVSKVETSPTPLPVIIFMFF